MNAAQPVKTSNKRLYIIIGSVLLGLCLICGIVGLISNAINPSAPAATVDVGAIYTSAAQTALAPLAKAAQATPTSISTQAPSDTDTPVPTTAPTQSTLARIGEPVTQDGYRLTVTNMEFANAYGYYTPDAGNHFLSVEVLIESGSSSGVNVNPLYATVKDSDGYAYNVSLLGKDPALASQNDLPQGEKVRGWLTFQVPINAHGFVFSYDPLTILNVVHIRVDLGQ